MRHLVKQQGLEDRIEISSAGTGDWHISEPRDRRSQTVGAARGIPLSGRARQFTSASFDGCDYALAMDRSNRDAMLKLARTDADRAKVHLLRSFDEAAPRDAEVPDPYYGGPRGFDEVFDLCEAACRGLIEHLRREHQL